MTEGEDSTVQLQELATLDSILDHPRSEAQGNQLPVGNHAMLSLGQITDRGRRLIARCNA